MPQPEFRGRDDDLDSAMAKRREFAVRYIAENNRLSDMNTRNERRLLKLGDAFWKAYWDEDMRCGEAQGDIRVSDIPVEAVFPDPAVRGGSVQDGQYLDYVYRIHKVRFAQVFRAAAPVFLQPLAHQRFIDPFLLVRNGGLPVNAVEHHVNVAVCPHTLPLFLPTQ